MNASVCVHERVSGLEGIGIGQNLSPSYVRYNEILAWI